MIMEILFFVWAIGAILTFTLGTYSFTRNAYSTVEARHKDYHAYAKKRWSIEAYRLSCFRRQKINYWVFGLGAVLLVSVASIFSVPFLIPFMVGRHKGIEDVRQREAQAEALKTLAHYETDPIAKAALEAGNGAAYVDRYLDLDYSKGEILDHLSMDTVF